MSSTINTGFDRKLVTLPIAILLPRRKLTEATKNTVKYKRIATSIAEVGVVEPLVVSKLSGADVGYLLLDGHLRLAVLQDLGQDDATCLVADDDEAFTYNKRVNHLATVQEHFMILRALENGVSEEKLARTLNLNVKSIKKRRTLLDGICAEVVDLLKDRLVNPETFGILRKMKPIRQIEAAELMGIAGNWTSAYAKALLAATRQAELARPDQPKKIRGLTNEQMSRMENEMASLTQAYKQIENSYGDDILHLVIAVGYLSRLVANRDVERYLALNHTELLEEFRAIMAATSLDQSGMSAEPITLAT
jgi:ParB-like chromosome segregation protein Spo0J